MQLVYEKSFVPEGCSVPATGAITMGAGQQFAAIYDLADANNVTFVGGADITVGASGGWVQVRLDHHLTSINSLSFYVCRVVDTALLVLRWV